jgi:hypothetical protein
MDTKDLIEQRDILWIVGKFGEAINYYNQTHM